MHAYRVVSRILVMVVLAAVFTRLCDAAGPPSLDYVPTSLAVAQTTVDANRLLAEKAPEEEESSNASHAANVSVGSAESDVAAFVREVELIRAGAGVSTRTVPVEHNRHLIYYALLVLVLGIIGLLTVYTARVRDARGQSRIAMGLGARIVGGFVDTGRNGD